MRKMSKLKRGLKIYDEMGKHLWRVIGSRSKSTLLGMKRADDYNLYITETILEGARRKTRGNKIKSGRKPCCYRVKQ